EVLRRLRFQKPHYSFRSQFCYSNSLYMTAGEVIPALTGQPWGDYVRAHFLAPLHMDSTVTSVTALKNHADVATPHAEVGGQVIPIEWANIDNVDPAGAIDSSVRDMAQWLRLVLADGKYDGRQLVSSAVLEQMQTPQMLIADGDAEGKFLKALNPGSSFYAYGLGFFLQDYAGTKVVWHSGHIDGMSAGLGMMPSRHVGVVVLSNMDQSWLPMALVWRVLDAYSGQPQHDWSGHILSYVKSLEDEDKKAQAKLEQAREPGGPSLPLKAYVGSYDNPLYGRVEITLEGGSLVMQLSRRFVGDMQHWNHQTFQVAWHYRYLDNSYARFDLDAFGVPQSLTLTGLATYTRVVEKPAGSAP
ncbi:MAG TPA: serine hydrolase, partial [Gammaproteobacteria bacterium]|nr:serine hydrolase [Gammaproteobacteria bacterium]